MEKCKSGVYDTQTGEMIGYWALVDDADDFTFHLPNGEEADYDEVTHPRHRNKAA
jgi:hypothetical protein